MLKTYIDINGLLVGRDAIDLKKLHICQKGLDDNFWVIKKISLSKFGLKVYILYNLLYASKYSAKTIIIEEEITHINKYLLYPTDKTIIYNRRFNF